MSFKDFLANDAQQLFLNVDVNGYAEEITHWPLGDPEAQGEPLVADVFRDNEVQSANSANDVAVLGGAIDSPQNGSVITRAIRLELLASVAVVEQGQADQPSLFQLANGDYCRAVRIVGADDDTQTVLCSLIDRRSWGRQP